tara:strand:+ start:696 stop:1076 length:381 start_codon:yes stop_codon:yes gene_type:complete
MGKVKAGSKLLKALGKTKKEQMAKVYPKVKGKGPYVRGTIGKKGADTFLKRRAVMSGVDATKAIRKVDKEAVRTGVGIAAATGAGYALGKYGPKKTKAKTHIQKARRGAKELIKKQKAKKEKHHSR